MLNHYASMVSYGQQLTTNRVQALMTALQGKLWQNDNDDEEERMSNLKIPWNPFTVAKYRQAQTTCPPLLLLLLKKSFWT